MWHHGSGPYFQCPNCSDDWLQLSVSLRSRIGGVLILLDVESTQQHDSLLSEDASITWIALLQTFIRIDGQNTSISSESIIATAVVDAANAILSQSRSTHDAGLNRDVEVSLLELGLWEFLAEFSNSEKFGVSSTIQRSIGVVHSTSNHLALVNENAGDWCFSFFEGLFGGIDGLEHESLVKLEVFLDMRMDFVLVVGGFLLDPA
jgi:hypothetical protein